MKNKFLNLQGLERFLQKIKGSIPTKTSELQNDSGYITAQGTYDSALSDTSEKAVQNKVIKKALDDKADTGHTHVSSEITDLSIPSKTSELTNDAGFITGVSWNDVSSKPSSFTPASHTHASSEVSGLSTVATSGSYNDLSNKPSIPSKTSDLTNDSGFLTSHNPVDSALSSTSTNAVQNKVVKAELDNKSDTGHKHTVSDVTDFPTLSTVATSGSYNDLSNKPTIPTVYNKTLTIQQNGTTVKTFTANSNVDVTANIVVPTKTSDLTNDSGYLTAHQSLADYSTKANTIKDLSISGKVITYTKGDDTTGTLTTQDTVYTHPTSAGNKHIPSGGSANQYLKYSASGTAQWATIKTSELNNDSGFLTSHSPVDSALSTTSENAVQNKVVKAELDNKANSADLSTVATTGSYTDLNNIPSNFTPASHTHGSITNDGKLGTASRALITDGNKKIAVSSVTSTELGYLSGVTSAVQDQLDGKAASTHSHTASEVSGLATVATSGSYNDLANKPTIPTVNNATLTIQKNGTTVKTFTANASSNVTANITVPTKVSELTNDSGFLTSHNPVDSALSDTSINAVQNKVVKGALDGKSDTGHTHTKSEITDFPTLATVATSGSYNDLSNKPTIPTVNNATLTIQKNGTTVKTFTANASSNVTANITVPTKVSELTNDSGFLTSASSLDSSKLTGTIDIARLPKGALERLVTVADQTARFALTTSDVQLGDTVKQLDTGVMYIVTDESKLSSADGYTEYTAGAATSVPWSGITGKPSSYTPASHSHGNIANGGTLGTASRALITDGNKKITTSSVTSTELGYVSGVTSAIQTQLNGKAASSHTHTASEVSGLSTVATSGSYNDLSNKPTIDSALSSTSTNAVQNKVINSALAGKAASSHTHTKSQITDFPTKTSQFTNDSHQTITVGTDTTSTASPAHSGTFTCIDSVTRDSNGHVTAVNTKTVTLPADNNTDTKVTNTLGTTTKAYVTGTTSATTNTGTQIFDTGVYLSTTAGELVATKFTGALNGNASTATQFSANKDVTLTGDVTGTASSKAGWSVATTLGNSGVTAGTYGPSADVTGNNNATISVPEITVDSKGRVTSVTNRTLTCKNNTYNVYNKTLTIQKNGTNVATFTSNSNTDVTANITVPTKTSELTNDSGYLTSHQSLSNYVTLNGAQTISGEKTISAKNVKYTASVTRGTSPSAAVYKQPADYVDSAGNRIFLFETVYNTDKSSKTGLYAYNTTAATGNSIGNISIGCDASGNVYTQAPTPATSDNSTKIATTAYVKAQGYLTSHQSLSNYSTLANTVKSLSISGKTITVTPGSGSAYTLTTQDTVYTHPTTSGNKHIPSGGSSGQFLGWDSDGTAKWVNNPNTNTDTLMTQNVSTTNATYPVLLVATADATANQGAKTGIFAKSVKVNPSTNVISASGFSGPLTGNVTGNCSGSSGSCTGNAATATQFSANKSVTLTGYINGTASSKAGWSIATALKNGYASTGGTVTNTYFKIASGILTGGWNRYETLIRFAETTGNASCTLRVYISLDGSSLFASGNVTVMNSVNFGTSPFNVVYKNDTDKTLFEIYYQITPKNHQINALVLYETERKASNTCDVLTMYNQSTPVAALPSDYTLLTTEFEKYPNNFVPNANNSYALGSSDAKWSNVYATTFTGNLTGNVTGNVTGNCSGTSANVTGTVAIANGGTGATSRLGAVKNLTNENVGTGTNYFLTITSNWGKAGYCSVADAKTVLGLGSAAYTASTAYAAASHTHTKSQITDFPTKVSAFTNDSGYLTSHQSLANYVTLNGAQTITATKTHTANLYFKNTAITNYKAAPTANISNIALVFNSNENKFFGAISHNYFTNGHSVIGLELSNWTTSGSQGWWRLDYGVDKAFSQVYFRPNGDNFCNLGDSSNRWKACYATNFYGALTGNVTGNCSGSSGSCTGNAATATQFSANKSVTLTGDVTGTASSKAGWSVATTLANSGVTAGTYGPSADVTGNNNATISVPEITVDAKGRVTSVTNRTLTCKNNTYSVYNKTLTIQKNGTNVATFTSNSNTDVTANITVPTKTSELTNDSGYLTSHQSLSNYVTLNGTQTISGVKTISTNLKFKTTNTRGTAPSAKEDREFVDYIDSAGNRIFILESTYSTDKSSFTGMYAYKTTAASGGNIGKMGIGCDSSGNVYTQAPTPATSDNSTKIATTAFVKAQGYLTSHQSLSNYSTLANTVKSLSISGKTITVTPGSGSAYTLTTQDTVYTHPTTAGNKHVPSGGSSGQFLGWDSAGTAKWVNNPNTDTKVRQDVGTSSTERPILSRYSTEDASQTANYVVYDTGVTNNPKTHTLTASGGFKGNLTGNCSGTAANVTGTVAIANGGTGATTRLNAVKALTNENVGTAATYFLGITNSWGKAGYISVADARTVLEIPTFAFEKFVWDHTINLSEMASSSAWEQITGGYKYTANVSLKAGQLTWIYVYLITSNDLIKIVITNGYILSGKNCVDGGKNSIKADTTTYGNVLTQTVCGSSRLNCLFYPYNSTVTLTMTYTLQNHAGGENPTLSGKVLIKQ